MICRLKPYEGDKPYIFFSYCHEDEKIVYPIVEMLGEAGYRIWYDEGIHAGADWPEVIARHLSACTACMVAISKSSVSSHNCRNEMTFAIEHKKRLVTIQIEDFVLPLGIQLQLASTHQIKMKDYQGDALVLKLKDNDIIKDCIASDDEQRAFFREVSQLDENLTISKQMQIEKVNREAEEFCRTLSETITCDTEAERRRQEEERRRQEEERRRQEEERQRREAEEEERRRQEEERQRREAEEEERRRQEEERQKREAEGAERRRREEERQRRAAEEAERRRQEEERQRRETERLQHEERVCEGRIHDDQNVVKQFEELDETVFDDGNETVFDDEDDSDCTVLEDDTTSFIIIRLKTQKLYYGRVPLMAIGRNKSQCDLYFEDANTMSAHHADIITLNGKTYLKAHKTTNGTFMNGIEVDSEESKEITNYAEIYLSKGEGFFAAIGDYANRILESSVLSSMMSIETGEKMYLFNEEKLFGRLYPWASGAMTNDRIGRKHAIIGWENGKHYIIDQSKNGTFINENRIQTGIKVYLQHGDKIRMGREHFKYSCIVLQDGELL